MGCKLQSDIAETLRSCEHAITSEQLADIFLGSQLVPGACYAEQPPQEVVLYPHQVTWCPCRGVHDTRSTPRRSR